MTFFAPLFYQHCYFHRYCLVFLFTMAIVAPISTQPLSVLRQQLTALEARHATPAAYKTEGLSDLLRETTLLLETIPGETPAGEQFLADVYLLRSLLQQRQGNTQGAFLDITTALENKEKAQGQLAYVAHLDQLALMLTVYKEVYAYPIELRQSIQRLLATLSPARRVAEYETVTINNLIRLADLKDRTGKAHEADELLREAEKLMADHDLQVDNRFKIKLFRVHRLYHKNALKTAEKVGTELLSSPARPPTRPREFAITQGLYAKILIGLGRLKEAEEHLREALEELANCCDGLVQERENLVRDLALCYQTSGRHEAARTLLEQQQKAENKDPNRFHTLYADFYGDLAATYFAEYQESDPADETVLMAALAHDRQARYHHYTHLYRPFQPFDQQWTIGMRENDKARSVGILCALYQRTAEEQYFYEAIELLEQAENTLAHTQLYATGYQPTPWESTRRTVQSYFAQVEHQGKTMVRYVSTNDRLFLLAWSERGIVFLPLAIEKLELAAQLQQLKQALVRSPNQAAAQDLQQIALRSHNLYTLLLGPIEKIAANRLLIIADEALVGLPFSLLLKEPTNLRKPLVEWPFAIHRYSFSYARSLHPPLRPNRQRQPKRLKQEILAFAPEFELGYLRTDSSRSTGTLLRNTEEVAYLAGNFPCRAFIGVEAQLDKFLRLAPDYAILHLATHATADPQNGRRGYLTFSSTYLPNKIAAESIWDLDISADLVVLSACDTGLGEWQAGGAGVVGLESAFLAGGAASVVSTYWKVSDRASSQFMPLFYDQLAKDLPKDIALQQAQLQFLAQQEAWLAHPFFWAGYVQTGSTSPIHFEQERSGWLFWVGGLVMVLGLLMVRRLIG